MERVAEQLKKIDQSREFRLGFRLEWKLVGTICLLPRQRIKKSHCADVVFMFVRTEAQNQGAGRLLLESTVERAREIERLEQLELSVSSYLPSAIHLYEKAGFIRTGVLRRQIKIGDDYHDFITM